MKIHRGIVNGEQLHRLKWNSSNFKSGLLNFQAGVHAASGIAMEQNIRDCGGHFGSQVKGEIVYIELESKRFLLVLTFKRCPLDIGRDLLSYKKHAASPLSVFPSSASDCLPCG